MKGEVTISLEDFQKLKKTSEDGIKAIILVKELDLSIHTLLEYLSRTNDIEKIAETYNKQGHERILKIGPHGWKLAKRN